MKTHSSYERNPYIVTENVDTRKHKERPRTKFQDGISVTELIDSLKSIPGQNQMSFHILLCFMWGWITDSKSWKRGYDYPAMSIMLPCSWQKGNLKNTTLSKYKPEEWFLKRTQGSSWLSKNRLLLDQHSLQCILLRSNPVLPARPVYPNDRISVYMYPSTQLHCFSYTAGK